MSAMHDNEFATIGEMPTLQSDTAGAQPLRHTTLRAKEQQQERRKKQRKRDAFSRSAALVLGASAVVMLATSLPSTPTQTQSAYITEWAEPRIEEAVRDALNQSEGLISFADAETVESISLNYTGIDTLSDVANLTGLTSFILTNNNQISDLTPLAQLTNLETLTLRYGEMEDLSPLASLTQLTELDLTGGRFSDISPLARLTNLQSLSLSTNNALSDITPLSSLTNLTTLSLSATAVTDLTPLASLAALESLSLQSTDVADITPLAQLQALTYVNLSYTMLTKNGGDFSPVDHVNVVLGD